ncbi:tautomerase family protein [Parabacteroides faecis]|uniref:4-oxalocrotonate tautomerase DmpI n=1 Tax=Parabacteroides faecis TaxID=1217282 RepID=UPI002164918A|nr:4-oxalocrotonate tautomerase DmpI [Parabacteroides faecis]MCS2893637.1 tautomerase family protein [Parabacteroides faecis]UVQ47770.1 tautomerase family protein [Parabacteroides faecis]
MPSIIMELIKMSKDKKAQLVKEVTESTSRITGLPQQAIFVFIKENEAENVGIGGVLLHDMNK